MSKYLDLLVQNIDARLKADKRKPAWLAREAGMPPTTLYKILKKEREPSLDTLEAIESKGFGLQPGELLASPKMTSLDEERLIRIFRQLETKDRSSLLKTVEMMIPAPNKLQVTPSE